MVRVRSEAGEYVMCMKVLTQIQRCVQGRNKVQACACVYVCVFVGVYVCVFDSEQTDSVFSIPYNLAHLLACCFP